MFWASLGVMSLAGEVWRPFLHEGGQALGVIAGATRDVLQMCLVVEGCVEAVVPGRVQRLLRQRDRAGRPRRQPSRDGSRLRGELVRRYDASHQPQAEGIRG